MATRYLVATGNWSDTSVWSATSGGAGGASVPIAGDAVTIDHNFTLGVDSDVTCDFITISTGTLNLNSHKLSIGERFSATGGTMNMGTGILTISASSSQSLSFNVQSGATINSGASQIILNYNFAPSTEFATGSKTYNDVVINLGVGGTNSDTLTISGSPTFRSLIIQSKNSAAHTVNFDEGLKTLDKLVLIGSSTANRLSIASTATDGGYTDFAVNANGTCYGQYVSMGANVFAEDTDPSVPLYIGSNSTAASLDWLLQDPPKVSTLVDPLTVAPVSNENWMVSGTVNQKNIGAEGGGYELMADTSSSASIISANTYDLVGSTLVFELYDVTSGGPGGIALAAGMVGGNSYDSIDLPIVGVIGEIFSGTSDTWLSAYSYPETEVATVGASYNIFKYFKASISESGEITVSGSWDGTNWVQTQEGAFSAEDLPLLRSTRISSTVHMANPAYGETSGYTIGSINPSLNASPTTTLSSPANASQQTVSKPSLTFTGIDPEGETVTYEVQVSTDNTFATTHTDAFSATDVGFSGTNPYASGAPVTYTLQTNLTAGGVTYYWRVRAKDPSGSNSWGDWSEIRTMKSLQVAPTVTSGSSSNITTSTATTAGNVTSDGGATITERGIVYGTSTNPTTSNSKITASGTTGSFTANLTGLTSNTTYHWRAYATNSKGTSYGSDQTFMTQPKPPVLTTGTASGTAIDSFSVAGSSITSNPDSQTINEYGVVYSTSANPTIANSSVVGVGTAASFDVALSGLTENTIYYIRAYAKWRDTDYAYGQQVTCKTQGRPTITLDSPAANGTTEDTKPNLKFTGTDADNNSITYQLQLNSINSFTSPLLDKLSASDTGFTNLSTTKADPFYSGNQIQFTPSTDLSHGQDYYWRVRAKDPSGSNSWGDWGTTAQFTVAAVAPTLTTNGSHDITFNTAEVDVTVNSDGGATITERGVCWSTSQGPTTADSKATDSNTGDTYTVGMTGLTSSTTYYVRAYAINSAGTSYGNSITIQTAQTPSVPTVITGSASITTDITSQFNGNEVTLDGTFTVTERGIVFSDTNEAPDINDREVVAPTSGLGSYDLKMTGLNPSTTYYVRAYAVNSYGTGYGEVVMFTTADPYVPDEGDGYWNWAPGQSQATIGRTQATPAYASVNLPLADLNLEDGKDYTLYFGSVDSDNGDPAVVLERFNDTTKIEDTIVPEEPFTFTYDEALIHWSLRLFVTNSTAEANLITAVFNDLYLAQESVFSGFVPFASKGITELKIINNEIVDDRREDVISSIFDQVHGISWYPFNIATEGLGYFEVGDRFTIIDDQGDSKSVVVWNTKLTIDGGISENLYTNQPDLTTTDYTKAGNSKLGGNIKNTQLQVDKQGQTINALVADMYDYDGVVNQKFSQVEQDLTSVTTTIQGAGGVNLIANSVMYAFGDDGMPDSWAVTGNGTLTIQSSPESRAAGAVSGNQFSLNDKTATQTVTVMKDMDFVAEDDKTYYSISARVKKNIVGSASITLTNRNETLTIDLPDQTSYYWDVVTLEGILPKDDHYDVTITSDADADLQVTDLILAPGKTRHEWTQANGEVMNASVAVTEDGITIRQSEFKNNYTKIDALGIEVHKTDAGGDRIFGFNDDETNVSKLKSDNQISMAPLRTVPINYSTYKGWAFTLSEDNN